MKIDIISLSGLTAVDGSTISSGATIKFETVFRAGSSDVQFILETYRNRELFEAGYKKVKTIELPEDINVSIPDNVYYTITPFQIYETVKNSLNQIMGSEYFEIKIIEE